MGSALLAASSEMGALESAAANMIRYVKTVDPDPALVLPYSDIYGQVLDDVRKNYNLEV